MYRVGLSLRESVECESPAKAMAAAMRIKGACIYRRTGEAGNYFWVLDFAPRFDGVDLERMRAILGLSKEKS